jgi:hypothetical protein
MYNRAMWNVHGQVLIDDVTSTGQLEAYNQLMGKNAHANGTGLWPLLDYIKKELSKLKFYHFTNSIPSNQTIELQP